MNAVGKFLNIGVVHNLLALHDLKDKILWMRYRLHTFKYHAEHLAVVDILDIEINGDPDILIPEHLYHRLHHKLRKALVQVILLRHWQELIWEIKLPVLIKDAHKRFVHPLPIPSVVVDLLKIRPHSFVLQRIPDNMQHTDLLQFLSGDISNLIKLCNGNSPGPCITHGCLQPAHGILFSIHDGYGTGEIHLLAADACQEIPDLLYYLDKLCLCHRRIRRQHKGRILIAVQIDAFGEIVRPNLFIAFPENRIGLGDPRKQPEHPFVVQTEHRSLVQFRLLLVIQIPELVIHSQHLIIKHGVLDLPLLILQFLIQMPVRINQKIVQHLRIVLLQLRHIFQFPFPQDNTRLRIL